MVKSRSSTAMILASCSFRLTRLEHCLQAIIACCEIRCLNTSPVTLSPVFVFCFFLTCGLIRSILAVWGPRATTLEMLSSLGRWLFAFLTDWVGVLLLRLTFVFFSRSFELNSPPSVRIPSRSVMYCDELTSFSSTRLKTLVKTVKCGHSYLRYSSFSRFWSILTREIHHFPSLPWFLVDFSLFRLSRDASRSRFFSSSWWN